MTPMRLIEVVGYRTAQPLKVVEDVVVTAAPGGCDVTICCRESERRGFSRRFVRPLRSSEHDADKHIWTLHYLFDADNLLTAMREIEQTLSELVRYEVCVWYADDTDKVEVQVTLKRGSNNVRLNVLHSRRCTNTAQLDAALGALLRTNWCESIGGLHESRTEFSFDITFGGSATPTTDDGWLTLYTELVNMFA